MDNSEYSSVMRFVPHQLLPIIRSPLSNTRIYTSVTSISAFNIIMGHDTWLCGECLVHKVFMADSQQLSQVRVTFFIWCVLFLAVIEHCCLYLQHCSLLNPSRQNDVRRLAAESQLHFFPTYMQSDYLLTVSLNDKASLRACTQLKVLHFIPKHDGVETNLERKISSLTLRHTAVNTSAALNSRGKVLYIYCMQYTLDLITTSHH